MTYQAVRRTPRPGQPSSTRHLGLRRAGGYAGLADAVPMLPPQRLAILGYDDAGNVSVKGFACEAEAGASVRAGSTIYTAVVPSPLPRPRRPKPPGVTGTRR